MTSLADQLKKLAIPQALQQRDLKKKPSLLFDEEEAANLDRDSFYDIGLSGLKELILKDPVFEQFSDNLFDINSKLFDRTVQSKGANKKLDKTIRKFLNLLSPYLFLSSAHKALEWLICRYHIQDFNTNDLMALILPYHETNIFAKILQIINLDLPTSKNFSWLSSVKKQGVHLPKSMLINHVVTESSFLRFICDTFLMILEEHKNSKGVEKLSTLVNFYCVTMINTLLRKEITDHHLTIILPSLMAALETESLNVKAAAYMVCGQLVAAKQISGALLDEIVSKVVDDDCDALEKEQVLLLVLIFQMQNSPPKLPEGCRNKSASYKAILSKLSEEGVKTEPFVDVLKSVCPDRGDSDNEVMEVDAVPASTPEMQYLEELRRCHGDKKESLWLKLREHVIVRFNEKEIFKGLCEVAPSYDKLVLMICLDRILKKSKQGQKNVVNVILKSNFGKTNAYMQEISKALDGDNTICDIMESFVLRQHKEFDNPIEFEAWLAAMNELKTLSQFSGNNPIWELGSRILIAALPVEFNATYALETLQFLRGLKDRKINNFFDVLNSLVAYIHRSHGGGSSDFYDLSSKNPDIWLKVRFLELIFDGIYNEPSRREDYKNIRDTFSKNCFSSRENYFSFVSAVCGGTPFENSETSEFSVPPRLQIYSLHAAWLQFKSSDPSLFNIFYKEKNRTLCYLLICLCNARSSIRKVTFNVMNVMVDLLQKNGNAEDTVFLKELLARSEEIVTDSEQLGVALYYLLSPSKSVQATLDPSVVPALSETRRILFSVITAEGTPLYVSAKLLSILETVNSSEIFAELRELASRSINLSSKDSVIPRTVVSNFWSRMNEETAGAMENPQVWDLVVRCMEHPKCEDLSPAVAFLRSVTKEVFETLADDMKFRLIELMVSVRSQTDCSETSSAIASAMKKINLDSKVILPLIAAMTTSSGCQRHRDSRKTYSTASIIESKEWKAGVSLLELVQSKKKLQNSNLLLKPLFDVLQFCFSQDEQTPFEYAKQLVLGCLLHCCNKLSVASQSVDDSCLNVELAVQCLRASPNPQTHHHALLLLSCMAALVPNQVMHNIMAIFTFMGTSVARLDDEHSVKIVTQVVDSVVPVLLKSINNERQNEQKVIAEILLVFVWALKDIPQHRRKPLFLQLLTTLGPEKSLWILILLLVENHVLHDSPSKTEGLPQNLFLGLQLTLSTSLRVILESVLKIVNYLNSLPLENLSKESSAPIEQKRTFASSRSKQSQTLFDIEGNPPRQLRHFAYTILTFLNTLLSNNNFIVQATEEKKEENSGETGVFRETMASTMRFIRLSVHRYEVDRDKFWKAVIHQCYEMLDKFASLVPGEMLLNVIGQLLHESAGFLRKKALDLFNCLLQNHKKEFSETEKKCLVRLLEPILEIVRQIGDGEEAECEILQQTALISLKLLARSLSSENLTLFQEVFVALCNIAKSKKCEGHLMGSVLLAIADQVVHLKVHSVSQLSVFLPLMLAAFSDHVRQDRMSDLGMLSVTTAIYKVVDALTHFLSPYLHKILRNVCVASVTAAENSDLGKKLAQIRQKLANGLESRVLIPSIATCYESLVDEKKFDAVGPLLNTLSANFSASTDVVNLVNDLSKFFFKALSFRSSPDLKANGVTLVDVDKVEGFVIEALVQLVLKLSESSFRPLYYQLCHWASESPDRNISFFRLSCRLAESLKGLFVLFAGHFLHNAADLLDAVNASKTSDCYFGNGSDGEVKSILLLENILRTLHLVFLYDSADTSNFMNKDKFEVLLHPLVDQLENPLGGMESLEHRTKNLLTPCLAQMALATDDTLWKSLNYQILVKTKSSSAQVRIGALETIAAMAIKLGEDYLTLLPETIGSLAELLEDEDERVERAMKKAIQELEEVLGQPIREYFQQ